MCCSERIKRICISLLNRTVAIFVAVAWSEACIEALDELQGHSEEENVSSLSVLLIFLWNIILYAIVIFVLQCFRFHPRLIAISRPFGELLGFQFKNFIIALASSEWSDGTIAQSIGVTVISTLILNCFIVSSRYARSLQKRPEDMDPKVHKRFETIIDEAELDGAAIAAGFSFQLIVNRAILGTKPTFDNISGISTNSTNVEGTTHQIEYAFSFFLTYGLCLGIIYYGQKAIHNLELDLEEETEGMSYDERRKWTRNDWTLRIKIILRELLNSSAGMLVAWSALSSYETSVPHPKIKPKTVSNVLYAFMFTCVSVWGMNATLKGMEREEMRSKEILAKEAQEIEDGKDYIGINHPEVERKKPLSARKQKKKNEKKDKKSFEEARGNDRLRIYGSLSLGKCMG